MYALNEDVSDTWEYKFASELLAVKIAEMKSNLSDRIYDINRELSSVWKYVCMYTVLGHLGMKDESEKCIDKISDSFYSASKVDMHPYEFSIPLPYLYRGCIRRSYNPEFFEAYISGIEYPDGVKLDKDISNIIASASMDKMERLIQKACQYLGDNYPYVDYRYLHEIVHMSLNPETWPEDVKRTFKGFLAKLYGTQQSKVTDKHVDDYINGMYEFKK